MNQYLKDKQYRIPLEILKSIEIAKASSTSTNGLKRANFMLKNGYITYQAMKRLKNFFDYFNQQTDDPNQFNLAGGQPMKAFIETTLNQDRNAVETGKHARQDMPPTPYQEFKPQQVPSLNEGKKKENYDIDDYDNLVKNALAVIVDNDNKILLLKRSDYPDQWQPKKWSLVGGGVEKGEKPDEACSREIKEEVNLDISIDKFIEKVVIQRNPGSVEHIFTCRYEGDPTDVELNEEHTNYGWYDVGEMEYLDIVPNLIDYINLVFKTYE